MPKSVCPKKCGRPRAYTTRSCVISRECALYYFIPSLACFRRNWVRCMARSLARRLISLGFSKCSRRRISFLRPLRSISLRNRRTASWMDSLSLMINLTTNALLSSLFWIMGAKHKSSPGILSRKQILSSRGQTQERLNRSTGKYRRACARPLFFS